MTNQIAELQSGDELGGSKELHFAQRIWIIITHALRMVNTSYIEAATKHKQGKQGSLVASIPGRVFAFITVRRTTGPGTSCLRMRQIFIVYLWSAKIFNKSIMEICTQKMHRVSTQKMHIGSCFTKAWGVASCAAAQLQ